MATRDRTHSEMPARTLMAALAIAGLVEVGKVALTLPLGVVTVARAGNEAKGNATTGETIMNAQVRSHASASASASSSASSGNDASECASEAHATTIVNGVRKEVHQSRKGTGGPGGCSADSHASSHATTDDSAQN